MCLTIMEECLRFPPGGPNWSFGAQIVADCSAQTVITMVWTLLVNLEERKHPFKST